MRLLDVLKRCSFSFPIYRAPCRPSFSFDHLILIVAEASHDAPALKADDAHSATMATLSVLVVDFAFMKQYFILNPDDIASEANNRF